MSTSERNLLLRLGFVMAVLVALAGVFAVYKDKQNSGSRFASAGTRHSFDDAAGPGAAPQSSFTSATEIYNAITPGMTEDELLHLIGKPDEDDTGIRDGIYAHGADNSQQDRLVEQALPPGRRDNGGTRRLYYKRGARYVLVTLIDTADNEHPQTIGQNPGDLPIWVVLEYFLR